MHVNPILISFFPYFSDDFPHTVQVQPIQIPHPIRLPPPVIDDEISSEEERPPSPVFDFSPPKATPSQTSEDDFPSQSVDEIDRKAIEEHLNNKNKSNRTDYLTPEYFLLFKPCVFSI